MGLKIAKLLIRDFPPLKFLNLEDAGQKTADLISQNNVQLEEGFIAVHENTLYFYTLSRMALEMLCKRMEELYGVKLDAKILYEEAGVILDKEWPKIKKDLSENANLARKINDIFK